MLDLKWIDFDISRSAYNEMHMYSAGLNSGACVMHSGVFEKKTRSKEGGTLPFPDQNNNPWKM